MISFHRFSDRVVANNVMRLFYRSGHPSMTVHPKRLITMTVLANVQPAVISFPPEFKFGVSTSAYQIEGAWNEDGKSPSVWDTFTHDHPDLIADGVNNDVGPDSYHLYNDDVDAVNHVGVNNKNVDGTCES
jgi:Glycosyl hydrolase family 1